ncbi:hypothetical protein IV203_017402 [Nitzschia inconspicua]|uniref:Uncharacterized protein n=1 Tax=Nitzschia inconspicua TaxID=303405 RepID=A0A9K3P7R6_9STRA|nr:hypothetical protein IV203_017587 [Nitzschia inconspicua]KAG7348697.1 hypothetical protein IV203_017402 [Nitzschia inconspicua]
MKRYCWCYYFFASVLLSLSLISLFVHDLSSSLSSSLPSSSKEEEEKKTTIPSSSSDSSSFSSSNNNHNNNNKKKKNWNPLYSSFIKTRRLEDDFNFNTANNNTTNNTMNNNNDNTNSSTKDVRDDDDDDDEEEESHTLDCDRFPDYEHNIMKCHDAQDFHDGEEEEQKEKEDDKQEEDDGGGGFGGGGGDSNYNNSQEEEEEGPPQPINRFKAKFQLELSYSIPQDMSFWIWIHWSIATAVTQLLEDESEYHAVLRDDQLYMDGRNPHDYMSNTVTNDGGGGDSVNNNNNNNNNNISYERESSSDDRGRHNQRQRRQQQQRRSMTETLYRNRTIVNSTNESPIPNDVDYDDTAFDPSYDPNRPWKSRMQLIHRWTWVDEAIDTFLLSSQQDQDQQQDQQQQQHYSTPDDTITNSPTDDDNFNNNITTTTATFHSRVLYQAYWKDTRLPVQTRYLMQQLIDDCETILRTSIRDGSFMVRLETILQRFYSQIYPVNNSNNNNNNSGSSMPPPPPPSFTLVSVSPIQPDYHPPPLPENFDRNDDSNNLPGGGRVYNDPLSLTWGVREWIGLAMLSTVCTVTVLLSASASFLAYRQEYAAKWGVSLTEQGVNELLTVGWRYHSSNSPVGNNNNYYYYYDNNNDTNERNHQRQRHHQQPNVYHTSNLCMLDSNANSMMEGGHNTTSMTTPVTTTTQLYLQIYDRRTTGYYNDENSLLKGGIEQEWIQQQDQDQQLPPPCCCPNLNSSSNTGRTDTTRTNTNTNTNNNVEQQDTSHPNNNYMA